MLGSEDPMVIQVILDGLGNILKMAGPQYRIIADCIEEVGGVEKIEALQEHQNHEIYKMAYFIIDRYFNDTVSVIIIIIIISIIIISISIIISSSSSNIIISNSIIIIINVYCLLE